MYKEVIDFIRKLYNTEDFIPLHTPVFMGNEKKYLNECIDSTFVSYVGKFVTRFEEMTAAFTGSKYAIAMSNGTSALQIALLAAGVESGDEIITQPLTFVATANAISHCGATPVFVDVDRATLGMSPEKLEVFLTEIAEIKPNGCYNKFTHNKISACLPVHIFGHPCKIDEIVEICNKYNIAIVEDSAESLGSYYKGKHTGTFGKLGILSYNGNKTVTTGGGGMILTNDKEIAEFAKHIITTAKVPHPWEFIHDKVAYNYRMPNVNAAIGVAQMESLEFFLSSKRKTAKLYADFFKDKEIRLFTEPANTKSNYWLNVVILKSRDERDKFLKFTNENKVMTRPVWRLMNKLEMFKDCQTGDLSNAEWLADRVVNIPSSYRKKLK